MNLAPNLRVHLKYDPDHEPRYGLASKEETEEAERQERVNLASGKWTAYGLVVESRCPGCGEWLHDNSLWGIVVESPNAEDDAFITHLYTNHIGPLPVNNNDDEDTDECT